MSRHNPQSVAERLAARTVKSDGCWEIQGCRVGRNGYGQIRLDPPLRKHVYAHRMAWELANGKSVPDGQRVCHSCDNPRCVRPSHLFIGTQRDNIHDSIRKGRYSKYYETGLRLNGQPSQLRRGPKLLSVGMP